MATWKKVIVSGSAAELSSLSLDTALTVANGGTGASSLTNGGILLGSGTGAITATSVLTNGQLLIGDNSGDPTIGTLSAADGLDITNGAGTIEVGVVETGTGNLISAQTDGTGVTVATDDRILISDESAASGTLKFIEVSQLQTAIGGGTVQSVAISGNDGIDVDSGSPITTTGTIELGLSNVPNSSLANSSVSFGGVSVNLGSSDATPAFDLTDATSLPIVAGTTGTLSVARGGTNATSLADKSVLITQDSGTDTVSAAPMDANGELLIGGTSGPAVATLTEGTGITITNADGSITIAADNNGDITSVANDTNGGLDVTSGTGPDVTLAIDINNLSAASIDVAADFIAFSDEGTAGDPTKKESVADLVTAMAGTNVTASSGVLSVNIPNQLSNLSGDVSVTAAGVVSVNSVQANAVTLGTDTTGNYVATVANVSNGGMTVNNSGAESAGVTLGLNLNDLSAATVNVANDSIAIIDADGSNATKKESIADLIDAIDGTGLTATSGVLAVDYGDTAGTAAQGNTSVAFAGTSNEIEVTTNFTKVGGGGTVTYGLPNDVTISNNLTVNGDLEVSGTASFVHSTNLDIADKFITLASGSTSATDGGIVVAQEASGATQKGFAFGFDTGVAGLGRWGISASFSNNSGALVPKDFLVSVTASTATPTAAPTYGGTTAGYGNMYIDTNNSDIYIYV